MESRPLLFPQTLHFTCRACAGCCRTLEVIATDKEVARFKDYDWAATRPRFAGRDAVRLEADGLYRLNHLDGGCIFLDDDNLCAIHKELGFEAKPFMCKHFPYYLTDTPEGVIVSYDFGCPTVIADDGDPIEQEGDSVRQRIAEWAAVGAELRFAMANATLGGGEPHVETRRGQPLVWADYLLLEGAIRRLLTDTTRPLTARLLMLDVLVERSSSNTGPGAMQRWLDSLAAEQWGALSDQVPRVSALRQRALIAPAIASIEEGWSQRVGRRASAGARLGIALSLVPSRGTIRLETADATLLLSEMRRVCFPQDDAAVNAPLVRFLEAFVVRKGLIAGTSVLQGSRYLALYFATIRWYAVARAALAERDAVNSADVAYAIQLVEKTLSRSPSLKNPRFISLINFLFARVAPAGSLYPSTYSP
jgi:Fe-S-cluster containining protein